MSVTSGTAVELLRGQGLRMTPQRLAIVAEVMATSGYVVAQALISRVQARVPGVSAATVYRTLERLERAGVLVHVHLESGIGYHRIDQQPHAHLICTECGAESELSGGTLQRLEGLVEREHGFRPDFTHQAMSGRCLACQEVTTRSAGRRAGVLAESSGSGSRGRSS
jgi:Fur family transcriptional regulator, ferric uptake regulator